MRQIRERELVDVLGKIERKRGKKEKRGENKEKRGKHRKKGNKEGEKERGKGRFKILLFDKPSILMIQPYTNSESNFFKSTSVRFETTTPA